MLHMYYTTTPTLIETLNMSVNEDVEVNITVHELFNNPILNQ